MDLLFSFDFGQIYIFTTKLSIICCMKLWYNVISFHNDNSWRVISQSQSLYHQMNLIEEIIKSYCDLCLL